MSCRIRSICLNCSVFACFLLLLQPVFGQSDWRDVDTLLQLNKKMLGNNVAIVIWQDGKIIHQKFLSDDLNAKTQLSLASASKWMTAALVMTFVEQGKIKLEDPVVKYIPEFAKYMKNYVTIRMCLTNVTGIENEKGLARIFQRKKYTSLEDEVNAIASKEISNNPGVEVHYGNLGPRIAGRVLEVVGKKPFDRLMQERIIRPLKLHSTSFTDDEGGATDPAAGGKSSALDYINFLAMLLNKGTFEGKKVLSDTSITEIEKIQFASLPVKYIPKTVEGMHFGLGCWFQEEDASGNGTVICCPSFFGIWPYIDKCRNYAAVIFAKGVDEGKDKEFALKFKEAVDAKIGPCK
jgi:CubicO group peptidase (beta-lactamase class C family)